MLCCARTRAGLQASINHVFKRFMNAIPNVLAGRYASDAMKSIWSAEGRIVLEREFWIAVM